MMVFLPKSVTLRSGDVIMFSSLLLFQPGKDLDAVLKATPILPEKEARIIIVQIFQGLVYLNKRGQKIIHYDLKPGNVLFDEVGVAKVTDFGLSKIVEDDVGSQGMELTSQGAGTYWWVWSFQLIFCTSSQKLSSFLLLWNFLIICIFCYIPGAIHAISKRVAAFKYQSKNFERNYLLFSLSSRIANRTFSSFL